MCVEDVRKFKIGNEIRAKGVNILLNTQLKLILPEVKAWNSFCMNK
jgi:hypothetical protein